VPLDGGIKGPAFEASAREAQAAQLPFEEAKAPVLGDLHPPHLGVGCGINRAKPDQQVPQVTLEARRPGTGEDLTHDGRRGGGKGFLTVCRDRYFVPARLASMVLECINVPATTRGR